MGRVEPTTLPNEETSDGQLVELPDGQQFRLVWSGVMGQVSPYILTRIRNGTLAVAFHCHGCQKSFRAGESYYNRKARGANRKSSFYCLDCAQTLGLIEPA